MRWAVAAAALSLAHVATAQQAEPLPVRASPVTPPTSEELACSRSGGTAVTNFADMVRMPLGQCVNVSGWHDQFSLAADLASLYAPVNANDAGRGGQRIGLTGVPARYNDAGVQVTAILRDCADPRPARGDMPDYCWFGSGRYLAAVRWHMDSQPTFQRLALADRPADLGNLARMTDRDAVERLTAAAAPVWAAIAANDEAQLAELLGMDDRIGVGVILHVGQTSVQRWTAGQPQVVVLGWRLPADATAEQQANFAASSLIEGVVCAADDATARANGWPIDTRDTAVHRERPYICATIALYPDATPQVTMRAAEMILPEPAR
jgi:hypothetical protein